MSMQTQGEPLREEGKTFAEMFEESLQNQDAVKEGEIVRGRVIELRKDSVSVDIGVKAFLAGSQVDLRPIRNLDKLIGQRFKFKVIKFNKKRGNIVLSRRVLLEQEREDQKRETMKKLAEGEVMAGVVKNLTD